MLSRENQEQNFDHLYAVAIKQCDIRYGHCEGGIYDVKKQFEHALYLGLITSSQFDSLISWFEYKETDLYGGKSVNSFEAGWKAALTALKDKLTNDNNIDNNAWSVIIGHMSKLK